MKGQGSRVQLYVQNWCFWDNLWFPKSSFWLKTHFWGNCHVQNYGNVQFYRKKNACGMHDRQKTSEKSFFEKMTRPKFSKMSIFQKKKRLRHARPAENSFKRHSATFLTQPSPNTTPKTIVLYEHHENRWFSRKLLILFAVQSLGWYVQSIILMTCIFENSQDRAM